MAKKKIKSWPEKRCGKVLTIFKLIGAIGKTESIGVGKKDS